MEKISKQEKEIFTGFLDEVPVFFVAINPDGETRYMNKTMLCALGYQKQEVWQKDYLKQFVPPKQHKMVQSIFFSLQKEGRPTYNDNIVLTKEGKELLVRWYGHPIYNDAGDFQYLIGIGIDITSQKKTELELKRQLKINQLLLQTSPVGITFVDKSGQITYANSKAEKILGLDVNEIRNRKYNDPLWQITDLKGKPFPEDKLSFNLVKTYLKPYYNIEHAIKWPDGKTVFLSINAMPILDEKETFQGAVCALTDITEAKIKERERERLYLLEKEHSTLLKMGQEMIYNLISEKDFSSKLKQILALIAKILPNDGSDISLLENNKLEVVTIYGYKGITIQNMVKNLRFDVGDYPLEQEVIKHKKPIIISDTSKDSRWRKIPQLEWIRSVVKIPFIFEGRVIGTLGIVSKKNNAFNQDSIAKIENFANSLAIALNIFQNYQHLQKMRNEIIVIIGKLVEIRDPYTFGHQKEVSRVAQAIAQKMNLPENIREAIRIASLVHDIGKATVPSEILSKPGRITKIEYDLIKEHPKTGYELLKNISFLHPIAEIVYQHHEKINGTGYPRGLKGDQIMLEARIICVADVLEAMTSNRPYRPALGLRTAEEELTKNKGILYDPEVVEACLKVGRKILKQ